VLLVNGELRVTYDVEEENVRDFQLDLFFYLGRHMTDEWKGAEIIATQLPVVERKAV
jgi:hypothetical protein